MKKVSILLIAAAVLMMYAGAVRGETDTVLGKGTKLCLECVGIG